MFSLLPTALLAGMAASITGGIVGAYVVVKRIVFISGSVAHSVLGGMGLFLWMQRVHHVSWASPLLGALVAAVASALLIGWIHLYHKQREDTVIAAIWSTGMAVGVVFTTLTPGYNVELMNFLFGNILWAAESDIWMLLGLDALVLGVVLRMRRSFLAVCFDETQALLQGVRVGLVYMLLLSLVAISTVILIQVVGAILVISMQAIPAAIAAKFTKRVAPLMVGAVGLSMGFVLIGVILSYFLNWPTGASIALVGSLFYILSLINTQRLFRSVV